MIKRKLSYLCVMLLCSSCITSKLVNNIFRSHYSVHVEQRSGIGVIISCYIIYYIGLYIECYIGEVETFQFPLTFCRDWCMACFVVGISAIWAVAAECVGGV
jgi:hypothetical protein